MWIFFDCSLTCPIVTIFHFSLILFRCGVNDIETREHNFDIWSRSCIFRTGKFNIHHAIIQKFKGSFMIRKLNLLYYGFTSKFLALTCVLKNFWSFHLYNFQLEDFFYYFWDYLLSISGSFKIYVSSRFP